MSGDGTIGEVEAPAKKRFKFPKKLVIAAASILLLLGGSGGAALYIGTDKILGKSEEELGGLDCKDVARIAIKRNDNQIWLHKYIKTDSTDGPTRIKTAIRVATGMAEKLRADLIHIVVLDQNGPSKRSEFRDLAFGAEVFYVRNPGTVPGYDATFTATYATGSAAANGNFYGKRRELTSDQVLTLARVMESRADCTPTDEEKAKMEAAAKAAEGHGKKEGHEAKPAEGEAPKHGEGEAKAAPADPALAAESKLDEALGIAPPPPPVEETKAEPDAKADKGFLDSMLSMVGLGSKEEPAAEGEGHAKPAEGEGHATPTEGEGHAAPAEGEGHAAPAAGEGHAAPAEGEAHTAPAEGEGHATPAEGDGHGEKKLPPSAVDLKIPEKPVEEKSMLDSVMGMVGLGSEEKPAAEGEGHGTEGVGHEAPAEGHAAPAEGEGHAKPVEGHGATEPVAAAEGHGEAAPVEGHAVAAEGEAHTAPAEGHAAPSEGHAAPVEGEGHDAPAATTPAETKAEAGHAGAEAPAEEPTDSELQKMKAHPAPAGHDQKAEASVETPAH